MKLYREPWQTIRRLILRKLARNQVRYGHEEGVASVPCFCCGICCTKYQVRLSLIEAGRINDRLGLLWDDFLRRYIDQYWPEAENFFLHRENGKCVFLGEVEDNHLRRCLIHPFKPSACKEWNPSFYRSECQEGLAKYWGLR